jgi:hypothetical protein
VRIPRALAAFLCGLALLSAVGCDPITSGNPPADAPDGAADALAQLDRLDVGKWHSMAGYSRDRFSHWSSQGDGCDTRAVVLKRDGSNVRATEECEITSGRWFSRYEGTAVTDPGKIDIDHMVPLANAWRTGADTWTDTQRGQFANDLDRPQLIAITATTNRSKGDQDPSQWKPPARNYWCEYAQHWIAVKAHWRLFVTDGEKAALEQMLETC